MQAFTVVGGMVFFALNDSCEMLEKQIRTTLRTGRWFRLIPVHAYRRNITVFGVIQKVVHAGQLEWLWQKELVQVQEREPVRGVEML